MGTLVPRLDISFKNLDESKRVKYSRQAGNLGAFRHERLLGRDYGSELQLLKVVQREVRTGGDQVEAFAADLHYAHHFARGIEDRRGHQFLNLELFGFFRIFLADQPHGLKHTRMFYFGERIEELHLFSARGM